MAPISQKPEISLAQRLAANDNSIRTKALKTLRKYINLRSQKIDGGFTSEDLLKIWKGLFYCLWMQDKPILQEEISHRISGLIHSFHTSDTQLLYFATFLQTMKREWNGIDRLRMDKFFQLVRFMFRQAFEVLKRRQWEASLVNQFLQAFTEQLLQNTENVPKGLMLHVLDLYMTELAQVGSAELTAEQNLNFIEPFCKTMANTKDRMLLDTISGIIFRTILDQVPFAVEDLMRELQQGEGDDSDSGQASGNEEEEIGEREKLKSKSPKKTKVKGKGISEKVENGKKSKDDVDLDSIASDETDDLGPVLQFDYGAVADRLFKLGSRLSTQNINRTKLYSLVKSFRSLCEGLFSQKEDDNGDISSTMCKNSVKKKRKNEKPTTGDKSVAKKSKVCQVQDSSLNTVKDSKHHCRFDGQLKVTEREADSESASQHNEPDSQSQLEDGIAVRKKRKSKKLNTNSHDVGGDIAHEVQFASQKSDGEHQTTNGKVKRKKKKLKAESGIANQASKDVRVLGQNCAAQMPELASLVENPVEAERVEGDISSMQQKVKKSKKLCLSLHDVGEVAADQSLSKEDSADDKRRTLGNDTNATQRQLEKSTTQKKKVKRKKSTLQDDRIQFKALAVLKNTDGHNHDAVSTHPFPKSEKGKRKKLMTSLQNVEEQVNFKTQDSTAEAVGSEAVQLRTKKSKKKTGSKYQEIFEGREPEVFSDSADIPANTNKSSRPSSVKKAKRTKLLPSNAEKSMLEAKEQPVIDNTTLQQEDTPIREKKTERKQKRQFTTEAKELFPKKIVKDQQGTELPDSAPSDNIYTPVINSLTPIKKGKMKRKLQTDEANISQNTDHGEEELGGNKVRISGTEVSTSVTPKKPKLKKGLPKSDFVSFQGLIKPPTPLFCKTKPKSSTPMTGIKENFKTPNSESKKVTFGLKNNKTTEFKKTDRSLLVSPVGSSRVVFDPKKVPASGVLKSPSLSPVVSVKKHKAKKRATAADFF